MAILRREALLHALELVEPGLTGKNSETVQQSSCFVFRNGKVLTFDGEVLCSAPNPLASTNFTGAVPGMELLEFLRKMSVESLNVFAKDKFLRVNSVRKSGSARRARFAIDPDITLPTTAVEKPGDWKPLHKDFLEALDLVVRCVRVNDLDYRKASVLFTPTFLEACDGFQLCHWNMQTGLTGRVFVRGESIKHVHGLGMTQFSETPSFLHFRGSDSATLSCRAYNDDEPEDRSEFLAPGGDRLRLPKYLSKDLERAGIFTAGDKIDRVLVQITAGMMQIQGVGSSGSYTANLDKIRYKGADAAFLINPKLLASIVERYPDCTIDRDRLRAAVGDCVFIACLVRPEELQETTEEVTEDVSE
jgi:hypothetical protein